MYQLDSIYCNSRKTIQIVIQTHALDSGAMKMNDETTIKINAK